MVAAGRMGTPTFQRRKLEPISPWKQQAGNEITEGWINALIVDVIKISMSPYKRVHAINATGVEPTYRLRGPRKPGNE